MAKLTGKVALVTGGGRGIGRSLAEQLAAEGAQVVVNDLDREPAEATVSSIVAAGGTAIACPGSISAPDFPKRFIGAALDRFGDIHILVNNAGYIWNGPLHKISDEQWDAIQDVHLKAPFRILRELHGFLVERVARETADGVRVQRKIVNISSVSATRGSAGQANYSAAKAGLFGLTRTLAKEWGALNVNVNCVAFGLIETRLTQPIHGETTVDIEGQRRRVGLLPQAIEAAKKQIALGRPGTPKEAAGGVMLFCFPESDYVTGQILEVAGGMPG
jgi:3-oxoacyl-[acyl-carrier protein] reductase